MLPTIPVTTPVGRFNKYWIGVILNCSDYNTSNNATGVQDVSMIEVDFPLTSTTTTTVLKPVTTTIPRITTTTTTIESDCPQELIYGKHSSKTELLRYFRDTVLNQTPEGQEIIKLYYEWSPAIVKAMGEDEEFKEEVKEMMEGVLPLIMEWGLATLSD